MTNIETGNHDKSITRIFVIFLSERVKNLN